MAAMGATLLLALFLVQAKVVLIPLLALILLAGITHVGLALSHSCPACHCHPTIQGLQETPNQSSLGQSRLKGWAGAVVNIVRRRRLVCIHCGAAYSIERGAGRVA
jgi:hypothetical protein